MWCGVCVPERHTWLCKHRLVPFRIEDRKHLYFHKSAQHNKKQRSNRQEMSGDVWRYVWEVGCCVRESFEGRIIIVGACGCCGGAVKDESRYWDVERGSRVKPPICLPVICSSWEFVEGFWQSDELDVLVQYKAGEIQSLIDEDKNIWNLTHSSFCS